MNLVTRFQNKGWKRIAFVGSAKHAGKTTAMNSLMHELRSADGIRSREVCLGLCSVGLDGERLDTILGIAKPPIFVWPGTLVASAERALKGADVKWEYLEDTALTSPLGNILIARAMTQGKVLLAGVRQRRHIAAILPRLETFGADMMFVDGAFHRVAAAVPHTVDAVILAIGAIMGQSVDEVAANSYAFLQRFQLPQIDEDLRIPFQPAVTTGDIAGWDGERFVHFPSHQAILGLRQQPSWRNTFSHVWLPGAVSDSVLQSLMGHPRCLEAIIAHPAQLIVSSAVLQEWYRRGHLLSVWATLPIAAVAVNPHSITGYDLPGSELAVRIGQLLPDDVPVFNALASLTGQGQCE